MTATFLGLFSPALRSTVIATPVSYNGKGAPIPTGSPNIEFKARKTGKARVVRDINGSQIVSSFQIAFEPGLGLTLDKHVYSIDGGKPLRPLSVIDHTDENGSFYTEIFFP